MCFPGEAMLAFKTIAEKFYKAYLSTIMHTRKNFMASLFSAFKQWLIGA